MEGMEAISRVPQGNKIEPQRSDPVSYGRTVVHVVTNKTWIREFYLPVTLSDIYLEIVYFIRGWFSVDCGWNVGINNT